jgi:plastocyanin
MGMGKRWGALATLLLALDAGAATHQVQVISFRFQPDRLEIQPGDTVVWTNTGGAHNIVADDGSFGNQVSSAAWTFTRTFTTAGEFGYYCAPHGGPGGQGMAGTVLVEGSATTPFAINYGTGGTWYNPATSGQGMFIEVVPSLNLMVFSWFTWSSTSTGDHDWLTGVGPISGDSASLDLQRSSGGRFNDPAQVTTGSVGSATVRFTDCNSGTVTFTRTDNGTSGTIPIRRLTTTPAACTAGAGQ